MNLLSRGTDARATRWLRGTTAALVTTATVVVFASGSATATLANNTFDGSNGDMVPSATDPQGTIDWATPNIGVATGIDIPSGTSDNAFGKGAKEDSSTLAIVTGSIPPNKNDLTRFYEASQTGSNGDIFLDLAWERLVNIGSANMDFEINHTDQTVAPTNFTGSSTSVTLNRTEGDVLVSYMFGGSGTPTIAISRWKTTGSAATCDASTTLPCWAGQTTLDPSIAEAAVNTGNITEQLIAGKPTLPPGLFGEASIDLTLAGVFPKGTCNAFGSVFVKSRSSGSSFDSELKDFIAPVPVHLNNCGSITIKKVTTNDPAGTQQFSFTPSTNLSTSTFSLANGGSKLFDKLSADTYTVQEPSEPAATGGTWSFAGYSCDDSNTNNSTTSTTATVVLALGANVTCTFTNHFTNSPTLATSLSSSSIDVGGSVHDTVTLTGASEPATGTVTYKVWTDNKCSVPYTLGGTYTGNSFGAQNLNADGTLPNSPDYTFANVPSGGKVYYTAEYVSSGTNGANNANADDITACNEPLTINKLSPSASTAQKLLPNDTFRLTAGSFSSPLDTTTQVTFALFGPDNATCSTAQGAAAPVLTESLPMTASGVVSTINGDPTNTSAPIYVTSVGTYHWQVDWPGDANNNAAHSNCSETFSITN